MGNTKYIAEISERTEWPPELMTATSDFNKAYNIYEILIGNPSLDDTSYLSEWGIVFDTPETTLLELFMSIQLQQVESAAVLLATLNSFYVVSNKVYVNLPYKPWQYKTTDTELQLIRGFSSTALQEDNPSDLKLSGNYYEPRLVVPTMSNKLSDIISGIALFTTNTFTLRNDDGRFDDNKINNYFNTAVTIKKTTEKNPSYSDFLTIKYGIVENQSSTLSDFIITISSVFRDLGEDVNSVFNITDYPSAPSGTIGKEIPKLYGPGIGLPIYEIDTNQYYIAEYITAVSYVYDSDGNDIGSANWSFNSSTGILTVTSGDPDHVDVVGNSSNTIGEIVQELVVDAGYTYVSEIWDTVETDAYIALSKSISLYISSGTIRQAVTSALESDNAFLIQKNDGRLTIRQWGLGYDSHSIASWNIMRSGLKKDFEEARKRYLTSIFIEYNYSVKDGYQSTLYDNSSEDTIKGIYNKLESKTFSTGLLSSADAQDLADRLTSRFGGLSERITIQLGCDTSGINILDSLHLPIYIGSGESERIFSTVSDWIVINVDPAQDTLTLEEDKG